MLLGLGPVTQYPQSNKLATYQKKSHTKIILTFWVRKAYTKNIQILSVFIKIWPRVIILKNGYKSLPLPLFCYSACVIFRLRRDNITESVLLSRNDKEVGGADIIMETVYKSMITVSQPPFFRFIFLVETKRKDYCQHLVHIKIHSHF